MDENIGTEWWEMDGMWKLEWCEMDTIPSLCDYFTTLCNISRMMNSSLSKSINGRWVSRTLTTTNKSALARELHLTHCTYSMFALKIGDEALDRVG